MKKLLILAAVLMLVACGSGNGTHPTTSPTVSNGIGASPGSGGEVAAGTPAGEVVVNITDVAAASLDEKTAEAAPTAQRMRLVITNSSVRFTNGSPYQLIVDGPWAATISGLALPVSNNYSFEIITYDVRTAVKRLLKYARAFPVNITTAGGTVNLATAPLVVSLAHFPNPAMSGQVVNISPSITQPSPLQTALWNLVVGANVSSGSLSPMPACQLTTALHTTTPTHGSFRLPVLLPAQLPATLCAQGEFFIKDSLLDTTGTLTIFDAAGLPGGTIAHGAEHHIDWTFNVPNPDFGDSPLTSPLQLVSVPITVVGGP